MTTATQTQIRRDTATNLNAATPASGELGYDTTNKRLVVGDGSTAGGTKLPNAKDVQNQSFVYPTVGGTGDAITLTNSPVVAAYTSGLKQVFKAGSSNTTAVTANVDSLGAKNVKKMNGGALASLVAGDIVAGGIYEVWYDGTQFQIKGLAEGPFTSGALKFLGSVTASANTTVDLNGLLSSTYDDYLILLDEVNSSGANRSLLLRFSTNNGSTFDAGSHYSYNNLKVAGTASVDANAADTSFPCSNPGDLGSTGRLSGEITLYNANGTNSGSQKITGDVCYDGAVGGTGYRIHGKWGSTGPVNAVRFLFDSGAVASGTFKVYGIAKS